MKKVVEKGFSLIEVLIANLLLSSLVMLVWQVQTKTLVHIRHQVDSTLSRLAHDPIRMPAQSVAQHCTDVHSHQA